MGWCPWWYGAQLEADVGWCVGGTVPSQREADVVRWWYGAQLERQMWCVGGTVPS